jgi:hypothetical protein
MELQKAVTASILFPPKILGSSPVVRIALVSISHTGNKRTMPELYCRVHLDTVLNIVGVTVPHR